MDAFFALLGGFQEALSVANLIACFAGVLAGTVAGVLPGIGPVGTMALLLPLSFGLPSDSAIIMLAGVYYGAMYGGSTTAILINIPGETPSIVTTFDGYQMTRKGRAGAALAISALGSFVAGSFGVIGLMFLAPFLARAALSFGPPEYFGVAVFGLILLSNLTSAPFLKSIMMSLIGMALGTIGSDLITGMDRFTFNTPELQSGIDFAILTMGMYGLDEVLSVADDPYTIPALLKVKLRDLYPNREELRRSAAPMVRGGLFGFLVGLIPGPSAFLASLFSYSMEKRLSKHPEEFGKGAVEGVAGPESANNAASAGAMVPLLALGLAFAPPVAVLLSGFMIHGIQPGPLFITQHGDLFWSVIASMYIGNVMLLVLNLPLVGVFASLVRAPARFLMPWIMKPLMVGAFSLNNSLFDLRILLAATLAGYVLRRAKFEPTPLIIGMVLGPVMERGLRQGLIVTRGDLGVLVSRPITATLLTIALAIVLYRVVKSLRRGQPAAGYAMESDANQ
ncbi:MAG: tripartite tricarboxylate transporter permease [Chloroflexi bacterium]|nr:tripartite tricarboxylate transporter permease [Chloroflexota bacterium]